MSSLNHIVVVGASLAGFRGIEALRSEGFEGRITAVGAEDHLPYDRPPLSKQFLKGDWEEDKCALRQQSADDLNVDWRLGRRAAHLSLDAQQVVLENGSEIGYDGLLIATGTAARALPGVELEGVHLLRTLDDAKALRAALEGGPRVAVVGAGFIGMEVAATCRQRGLEVTVVEALDTPLVRGLGPVLGEYVASVFRDEGVELRCGVGRVSLEGEGRVRAVVLQDGTRIAADVVVVGIGAAPVTDWLENSGLALDNGVLCDESCATGAPGVVVAGDVARWKDVRSGKAVRIEHWTNAVEQSAHAAKRLLHGDSVGPYLHTPYVWSDQFHLRMQIAGEIGATDEMHVCHGSFDEGRFVALFGRKGKLSGAVGFRRPRQLLDYRDLVGEGASWDEALARAVD